MSVINSLDLSKFEGKVFSPIQLPSKGVLRSISEISSCFFGPRPWHIEIRHRVKQTLTINLFGSETLKLKIRRVKLWKPTVLLRVTLRLRQEHRVVRQIAAEHHGVIPGVGGLQRTYSCDYNMRLASLSLLLVLLLHIYRHTQ